MFVTPQTGRFGELLDELAEALAALGLGAQRTGDALVADGTRLRLRLVERAHPNPAELAQLVRDAVPAPPEPSTPGPIPGPTPTPRSGGGPPTLVVADRISEPGRELLRRAGWGWLDRRGHVRVWAPGVRIESPLPVAGTSGTGGTGDDQRRSGRTAGEGRGGSGNPWTTVGLEIVLAALLDPSHPVTARRVAPRIGRSVGAVHELVGRFARLGLIGPSTHLPLLPDLFWEAAGHWPDDDWLPLAADLHAVSAKLGAASVVRVDERAASLGGASIPAAGDLPARAYLPAASALRRVRGLADRAEPTRCWVRVAPVRWLPDNPDHPAADTHPWRVAHPLVCALRLAADPARGREIVEAWGVVPMGDQ